MYLFSEHSDAAAGGMLVYIYENSTLQFFSTSEGYVEPVIASGSEVILSFNYIYQYKDHLGNVRLSYADDNGDGVISAQAEIREENNYYPFGLRHVGYNGNQGAARDHKYQYNGKEIQEELGLNWYDYGARNYDASLGRWMNIDPLAEKYTLFSPYNYTMNNPVYFIDPNGEEVVIHFDKKHNKLYIYDKDKWDSSLETKTVNADEYKFSFEEGEERYNQILVIDDVFSGGHADSKGEVEYETNEKEKEIPNGEYSVVDNKASDYNPEWYRLDPNDSSKYNDQYDDETERNSDGEKRTGFRLHIGTVSWGCVTICKTSGNTLKEREKEWDVMNEIIQTTKTRTVNDRRGRQGLNPFSTLTVYGTMTVSGSNPKPKSKNKP